MSCEECQVKEQILAIIDEEYTLWRGQQIEAESKLADILARRIEYQLATIRRIRKKILGMPVNPPVHSEGG